MSAFVVFEGLDGCGKSTQIKMLMDYLSTNKISYKLLDFPRFSETMIGEMIGKFLRGEFGDIEDTNPYIVALMYAQDRFDAKDLLYEGIENHELLIVDRYVYSNAAFQSAKINDKDQSEALRDWILQLEYMHYGLPKQDLSLYLNPPCEFIHNNLTRQRVGNDRDYLKGCIDIHENDLLFQKKVEHQYLELIKNDANFKSVDYEVGKTLLSPMEIHQAIVHLISDFI